MTCLDRFPWVCGGGVVQNGPSRDPYPSYDIVRTRKGKARERKIPRRAIFLCFFLLTVMDFVGRA